MAETIHEQIAQWIAAALDGKQDPDATLTLHSVRPKILDWTEEDFKHGDVIIWADKVKTLKTTTKESRTEEGIWFCHGIIRELPADTVADTVVSRMIETIRSLLLAGNLLYPVCGGIAKSIECPECDFDYISGALIAEVIVKVIYMTARHNGYAQT